MHPSCSCAINSVKAIVNILLKNSRPHKRVQFKTSEGHNWLARLDGKLPRSEPGSVSSGLAVVGSNVETVFALDLEVESRVVSEHKLRIARPTIKKNHFERKIRRPLVHRVAADFICTACTNSAMEVSTTMTTTR